MTYKNPVKPYLYIQQPIIHASSMPHYIFKRSLADCVFEVNADKRIGLDPGVIYVRYSRVAALLRENEKLREQLTALTPVHYEVTYDNKSSGERKGYPWDDSSNS